METTLIQLPDLGSSETFGRLLGKLAMAGDIICLDGDLGAGKTTLTQFIAKGLDIPEDFYVSSPSFNVFHEYPGRLPLYHMDFYRLQSADDVVDMGLDEYLYMAGVTVVEWSERALELFPLTKLSIFLKVTGEFSRNAVCIYSNKDWLERINLLSQELKK